MPLDEPFMDHAIGWTISWDLPVIFFHEIVLQKFYVHVKFDVDGGVSPLFGGLAQSRWGNSG
jgi:hypothetical protein